jgi:catechol 2,3-dioxygenase-like lactoylglutathione lyase family enzyme
MSALPPRLSFVTIGTRDHRRMRDFYAALGFPIRHDLPGEFASFLLGGVVLALFPIERLGGEAAPGLRADGEWNGITLSINVGRREEVDGAFAAAIAAGGTVIAEPVDREYGPRSGYFADPEGNRWEVAWAAGIEFDERGAVTDFRPT